MMPRPGSRRSEGTGVDRNQRRRAFRRRTSGSGGRPRSARPCSRSNPAAPAARSSRGRAPGAAGRWRCLRPRGASPFPTSGQVSAPRRGSAGPGAAVRLGDGRARDRLPTAVRARSSPSGWVRRPTRSGMAGRAARRAAGPGWSCPPDAVPASPAESACFPVGAGAATGLDGGRTCLLPRDCDFTQ